MAVNYMVVAETAMAPTEARRFCALTCNDRGKLALALVHRHRRGPTDGSQCGATRIDRQARHCPGRPSCGSVSLRFRSPRLLARRIVDRCVAARSSRERFFGRAVHGALAQIVATALCTLAMGERPSSPPSPTSRRNRSGRLVGQHVSLWRSDVTAADGDCHRGGHARGRQPFPLRRVRPRASRRSQALDGSRVPARLARWAGRPALLGLFWVLSFAMVRDRVSRPS